MTSSRSFDQLTRRQHGIVTGRQIRECGLREGRWRAQLDSQRWRRINDRVLCTHNGPLTRRQQLWAVVLSAPGLVALSGLTLLKLHGLRGFSDPDVHLLMPKGTRVLDVPGVSVVAHQSRRFPHDGVRSFDDLPVTLPDRAAVDAATWSNDELTASRIVVAAAQQLRVPPAWMLQRLLETRGVRHRRLLSLLLHDLDGGAQALSEVEFLAFCRRNGFPRPRLQVRLDGSGRRRYLDAEFRASDGSVFWVEIDGGIHLQLKVKARDDLKDNYAKLDRRLVLRYASVLIYTDDPEAVEQIRRALGGKVSASHAPMAARRADSGPERAVRRRR